MRQIKRTARRAAQFDTTVLLLGETGTGKELLAHAIHAASNRADRPFVAVNAAAVPETLMEAEFFGVAPGAYTGADRRGRDGKFALAEGGTLFLDEVGDMPLGIQAKLLRVLQEREIEPIGSNKVFTVDVRVIAATSQDLTAMVRAKTFRADLYYRLSVLPITLPPLRDRLEDIPDIADALLEDIARKTSSFPRELTSGALDALSSYRWPGNVRELVNVLERITMLSDSLLLTREDVAMVLPDTEPPQPVKSSSDSEQTRSMHEIVAEAERSALADALRRAGGVKSKAARLLGLSRTNLYDKLNAHGLL
jgi:transcriptional regulator with PAS, ATPase and Fis domain